VVGVVCRRFIPSLRVRRLDELVECLVGRAQSVRLKVLGFFEQLGECSGICRHVASSEID
jgi:hypothetical protein